MPCLKFYQFIIILMATKLQKLQKIRLAPSRGKVEPQGPPAVTQTIIINNPNININYMNDGSRANGPLSSRGLDNWHLNNNLKQFSETRQLGFFKNRKERNKSNSPYIIHKVRTQDLRSINKIYAPSHQLKDTLTHFRKNQTIAHMPPPETQKMETLMPSTFDKMIARQDKTNTEKFYQPHIRKTPRTELQKNFQTLPTNYLSTANPEVQHPKSFRRGRFEPIADNGHPLTERKQPTRQSNESDQSPGKGVRVEADEERDQGGVSEQTQRHFAPRMLPLQMRRRAFTKTIAKIDQSFLKHTDNYLDRQHAQKLPQAEIQLLVNSVGHPERMREESRGEEKFLQGWGEYDFQFEEERKKRPKTPKRKKPYNEED